MWHLLQASLLQISPFGAYLLKKPLHPKGYLYPHDTSLPRGGLQTESCYRQAGSGAVGSGTAGLNVAGPNATDSSDGTTLVPATPILQKSASNTVSTGGSAAKQDYRAGSHLQLLCRQTCCCWWAGCCYPREASYLRLGQ